MKQNDFIATHNDFWNELEQILQTGNINSLGKEQRRQLPHSYRRVCHHLSLAQLRNYSPALQNRLNRIALQGHQLFYARKSRFLQDAGRFFAVDFPRSVRAHKYYVLVSALVFFGPLIALLVAITNDPTIAYAVIDPETAEVYKEMYGERGTIKDETAVGMFGYYIWNNVSIALRTFAMGLVFGLGAIFILLFNGTYIGAVAGLLTTAGLGNNFWPFVAGHGAFELTAIVLAGASGMKIGFALLIPGLNSRRQALKNAAQAALPMIYGFVMLLILAAAIEAFWSPNAWFSNLTRYAIGVTLWVLVIAYLLFGGRGQESRG
ncbi:MAG: stage II sporulation protein M [Gammaproteobacteria bacterium]|nr:stage II sporulation protein M [Gammaproteobacteria bacterium]